MRLNLATFSMEDVEFFKEYSGYGTGCPGLGLATGRRPGLPWLRAAHSGRDDNKAEGHE